MGPGSQAHEWQCPWPPVAGRGGHSTCTLSTLWLCLLQGSWGHALSTATVFQDYCGSRCPPSGELV